MHFCFPKDFQVTWRFTIWHVLMLRFLIVSEVILDCASPLISRWQPQHSVGRSHHYHWAANYFIVCLYSSLSGWSEQSFQSSKYVFSLACSIIPYYVPSRQRSMAFENVLEMYSECISSRWCLLWYWKNSFRKMEGRKW